ncbi:MAG: PIN domain-containing protein [bacterium]|nr:PIN domain-containing protein [bacterium]
MRLVVDTNILVSALVFGASAKACLDLIAHNPNITLLVSAPVAREYLAVLQKNLYSFSHWLC